jgi:hypothetical protein
MTCGYGIDAINVARKKERVQYKHALITERGLEIAAEKKRRDQKGDAI